MFSFLDSTFPVISFTINNRWNKDLLLKQTIRNSDDDQPITRDYSVDRSKKTGFFYKAPSEGGSSSFQFIERETGLLVVFPNGDDEINVMHQPYRQDIHVTIDNASK